MRGPPGSRDEAAMAARRGPSSAGGTGCSSTWMAPSASSEIWTGFLSWSSAPALLSGRSTGTPATSNGAVTMKMMSRTSITSTIGVTLISAIGERRARRCEPRIGPMAIRLPPHRRWGGGPGEASWRGNWQKLRQLPLHHPSGGPPPHRFAAGRQRANAPSSFQLQLAAEGRVEAVGEALEPRFEPVDAEAHAIVGDHGGDRGEQAERGREQGLGDSGGDDGEAGVVGAGDGGEASHDPPHRAE